MKPLNSQPPKLKEVKGMTYKLVGYKKGRKLGSYKDDNGKVVVFKTKQEAITAANIESLQFENIGIEIKVVQIKSKK